MKEMRKIQILLVFALAMTINGRAQVAVTPYDELPNLNIVDKPAYCESFPEWAKMLYQYPVNANEIEEKFRVYSLANPGIKSAEIRYYKLWREAVRSYTMTNGDISLPEIEELKLSMVKNQKYSKDLQKSMSKSGSSWTLLGPINTYWRAGSKPRTADSISPWQANVYSFDVSASNTNILYCGTETGMVNKTIDKGFHWNHIGGYYNFGGGILAIAVHPERPDTVYVSSSYNIHRTVDGGENWTPMLANSDFHSNRLKIDYTNPSKLIAASTSGVWISTDNGEHWNKSEGISGVTYDVDIHPTNSNLIYAVAANGLKLNVYMSNDGGSSFQITEFPETVLNRSGAMLAVTPAAPNNVYTVLLSKDGSETATPYMYKGIYNEDDGTMAWYKIATGRTTALPMTNGQGYFDLVLEVSPLDANIVLVGTTDLYKSTNGGTDYYRLGGYGGSFVIHPDIQDLKMLPDGETWVSTDGGMILTTDGFVKTDNYHPRVNGIVGSQFWGFDQGWNQDIVVGGRYHNGNTAMADFYGNKSIRMGGGENATGWVIKAKSRHVAFADLGGGWILGETAEEPAGRFPFNKFPNMDAYGAQRGALLHHPNYNQILYVGEGNSFWKSTDMGVNWDMVYTFPGTVRYMDISFSNPNVLYADVVGIGLYKSINGGETWEFMPSLTQNGGPYGNQNWAGNLFFVISPTNPNVIYVAHSNGSPHYPVKGEVFKSVDGGVSWENYTGTVNAYLESLAIQPDATGRDLLYLTTIASSDALATVYYRTNTMDDWGDFGNNFPRGNNPRMILPFFRDSKLRVSGSASVWESPLAEPGFRPIINPWVQLPEYSSFNDTLYFDDHSILNHEGASWEWVISPEPVFISDAHIRNPKVVLGSEGDFSVTLIVTKGDKTYQRTIPAMVTAKAPPTLENCENPAEIPKTDWNLLYVDSEEMNYNKKPATNIFDGDISTFWHTEWYLADPVHPHEVRIEMDTLYEVHNFSYYARQDLANGRIKEYELYLTEDTTNWGEAVSVGEFLNSPSMQIVNLDTVVLARYLKLVALSSHDGSPHTTVAEISMVGCYDPKGSVGIKEINPIMSLKAFPVPADNNVNISLPHGGEFLYNIFSVNGAYMDGGKISRTGGDFGLDLNGYGSGLYLVKLQDSNGTVYRVRFIKE